MSAKTRFVLSIAAGLAIATVVGVALELPDFRLGDAAEDKPAASGLVVANAPETVAATEETGVTQTNPESANGITAGGDLPAGSEAQEIAPEQSVLATAEPETAQPETAAAEPKTRGLTVAVEESAAPEADPTLDIVRVDPRGRTVVAGRAEPDSEVEIVVDDKVVAREKTDASGNFASHFQIGLEDKALQLALRTPKPNSKPEEPQDPAPQAAETAPVPEPEAEAEPAGADQDPAPVPGKSPAERLAEAKSGDPEVSAAAPDAARAQPVEDKVTTVADPDPQPQIAHASLGDTRIPQARTVDDGDAPGVLILPAAEDGGAPLVVAPEDGGLKLLQPARDTSGVQLDRISYHQGGELDLLGRATPGNRVRIYSNAELAGTAEVVPEGRWHLQLPLTTAQATDLLRFDEIDATGSVVSRIETPFKYNVETGDQRLAERSVEIAKGDYLWRIAERYYGEGLRYSLIFSANSKLIRDPDLIYPGQVFTVPELVPSE